MEKIISAVLALILVALSFVSCTDKDTGTDTAKDSYKIGIIQYMSHPSLDNCCNGIMEAINASDIADKVTVDRQTGSANSADSDCSAFAKSMVASGYDIIFAIATPAAISAYAATEGTDIPVIFCAVSDPVKAELVASLDAPGDNCTGTSDVLDLKAQVKLIQSIQPDVKNIGILYTTSEVNSISNLEVFKSICEPLGINVDAVGVQNSADIPSAATALASRVDCINNFTDNNVVNNLEIVLDAANNAKIPVYGSEVEQVTNGCLAAVSIDYVALGKVTGEMGLEVLGGKPASEMAVRTISDGEPVVNKDAAASLGLEVADAYVLNEK